MKVNRVIANIVLVLSVIFVLLLWPITFLSLDDDIWLLIQKRNDVPLQEKEIKSYNQQIVSFFKDEDKNLDFLTQVEVLHMQDVKGLIAKGNLLFIISLALSLLIVVYFVETKYFKTILKKVSLFVLLFLILLLVTTIIGFTGFFFGFHKIFFVSNFSFPETSMLKVLYPDGFFRDIFIVYFILALSGCSLTLLISYKLKV